VLRVKLRHLTAENARRMVIADAYRHALTGSPVRLPTPPADRTCVYHQFVVRHPQRDRWRDRLASQGIGTAIHYRVPVHLQPAYQSYGAGPGSLPVTEQAATEVFSLPVYPQLSDSEVIEICRVLKSSSPSSHLNHPTPSH